MKIIKALNIGLVVLCAAFFSIVLVTQTAMNFGAELPAWLQLGREKSSLEARTLNQIPEFNAERFASGEYQQNLETALTDGFPLRDEILNAHADLERSVIEFANVPMGFSAYPTFYGSDYAVVPEKNALVQIYQEGGEELLADTEALIQTINEAVSAHPEINYYFDLLIDKESSELNPTFQENNTGELDELRRMYQTQLSSSVDFFQERIKDSTEFYEGWFRTDNHWKIARMIESYNEIAEHMGLPEQNVPSTEMAVNYWLGSYARPGLDRDYSDQFSTPDVDFSQLTMYANGEEIPLQDYLDPAKFYGPNTADPDVPLGPYDRSYTFYWSIDVPELTIENHGSNNGKTLLCVGTSLLDSIRPFLALDYQTLISLDTCNQHVTHPLGWYLDNTEIDDCLFQLLPSSPYAIEENSPEFYE